MKFTKLNIKDYLIIEKIPDFNNRLCFDNNEVITEGTFSNYCIGKTLRVSNYQKLDVYNYNEFLYLYPTGYTSLTYYYSQLYDVLVENIEKNVVYSYYSFSTILDTRNWIINEEKNIKEKEELQNRIIELQAEIDRIKKEIEEKEIELGQTERGLNTEIDRIKKEKKEKGIELRQAERGLNTEIDKIKKEKKEKGIELRQAERGLNTEIDRIKKKIEEKEIELRQAERGLNDVKDTYKSICSADIVNLLREDTIKYARNTNHKYFLFNNELYYYYTGKDPYRYTQEQLELLLKESIYKEDLKFNKLKKQINFYEKFSLNEDSEKKREPISEEVRAEVWRRDGGKCVICGSNENLEFDHLSFENANL